MRGCHTRRTREDGCDGIGRHEYARSQRDQLPNGHAITRDDERFTLVQGPHDSSTFVAELSLSDAPAHVF